MNQTIFIKTVKVVYPMTKQAKSGVTFRSIVLKCFPTNEYICCPIPSSVMQKLEQAVDEYINQQAEEIEMVRQAGRNIGDCYDEVSEENKKLKEEIEKLNKKYHWLNELFNKHDLEKKEEIKQLQSRVDELVKSLEGVDKWSLDDVKLRGSDELVESRAIQSLISKAKGQTNERV